MDPTDFLDIVTKHYLNSRDFNGCPLRNTGPEARELARVLVARGDMSVVFGDIHPNPYIKALADEPTERQLAKLAGHEDLTRACAYPSAQYLERVVDQTKYAGRPYERALALGSPQLAHRAFDLHVLERYRNDPRYSYDCDDIWGSISGSAEENGLRKSDSGFMRFGFAYDDKVGRYVAGFVWDLFRLTPEQQQHWKSCEVERETHLHPDYYRTQILGEWAERISIYEAFIEELQVINAMAAAVGRPSLFRADYKNARPKTFASLLRPTLRELTDFIRLLDQMISDNINLAFFQKDVERERELVRPDGKIETQRKGSLQILEEWINKKFRPADPQPLKDMFATFRKIRQMRNKPSHSSTEDEFSADISETQRTLMLDSYGSVRTLRLLLANYPGARSVEITDELREGKIWSR